MNFPDQKDSDVDMDIEFPNHHVDNATVNNASQNNSTHAPPKYSKDSFNHPSEFTTANPMPAAFNEIQETLYDGVLSNLQTLKLDEQFANVKFVVHFQKTPSPKSRKPSKNEEEKTFDIKSLEKETNEISKVFYGLKILFAAYSPVFDEMLYDDENEESFASDKKSEEKIDKLGGLDDDGEESIKTIHLYDIHPIAFEGIYDMFLGMPHDCAPSSPHFTGWQPPPR